MTRSLAGLSRCEPAARRRLSRCAPGPAADGAYRRLLQGGAVLRLAALGPGGLTRAGRTLAFRTHNAERALFALAFAGHDGLHVEELADRLWPGTAPEHTRLLGRVRTLLWDIRQGLGQDGWRLRRSGPHLRLDVADVEFDVGRLRELAAAAIAAGDGSAARTLAAELRRPLLTRWAYDEWVLDEDSRNRYLADRLRAVAARHRPTGRSPGLTAAAG